MSGFAAPARAEFSLRELLVAVFYHKRAILLAFLAPALLGLAAGFVSHTHYVAQARLLVLYGSDYIFHPGPRDTGNDIALDRNQIIQGELQILDSPALLAEVVRTLGPQTIYPGLRADDTGVRAAVTRLNADLTLTSIPQSNVIELGLRNADRDVAIQTLGALISHYLVFRSGIFEKSSRADMSTQRDQFAVQLHQAEQALAQFGIEHGISNFDEQLTNALQQRDANTAARDATVQAIGEAQARIAMLHARLAKISPTVEVFAESGRTQQSATLQDSLAKLEVQRRSLLSRYRDDFPLVQDVDQQIAGVRAQLRADPSREGVITRQGRNQVFDDLQKQEISDSAQLMGLQAKQKELEAQADRLEGRLAELTALARQYRDLQRTRDVLDQSYRAIARSSEETAMADALERAQGANVRVVQPADAPLGGQNKRLILWAGGIVMGLMCAGAAFAVLNAIRPVLISARDAERQLDIPVLAAVALMQRAAGRDRRARAPGRPRGAVQAPSYGT